ncbi:MAG: MerR family transcriptional regulator [Candidatus Phosphoribacter baldrii]
MITIGEFARLGQVSVRMLRHYDALGLLVPARVDGSTGHRYYEFAQLARLNRLCALKDLGFTLERLRAILDEQVSAEELRGMLRLRHEELAERIESDRTRLADVERRLRSIESEGTMSEHDVIVTSLDAVRVAVARTSVEGPLEVAAVIGPMFATLAATLSSHGLPSGPPIACYAMDQSGAMELTVAFPYDGAPADDLEIIDLPAVPRAASVRHLGAMDSIHSTWAALMGWIEASGLRCDGPGREVYLNTEPADDQTTWVTEIQQPVTSQAS